MFASGEPELDDWLRQRALTNIKLAATRTYVLCEQGQARVVGFFALSMGQALASDLPGSMRRNMPRQVPVVLLARLAVDRSHQGKGIGRALLQDALRRARLAANEVSARLMITHPMTPAAEAFYLRNGFTAIFSGDRTFALDLAKLRDWTIEN